MSATCRSCRASVLFVQLAPNGKVAPMNADPTAKGNVRVTWQGAVPSGRVLPKAELAKAREVEEPLYLSHFATCSAAKQFRKG